jgi:hypothetical protein
MVCMCRLPVAWSLASFLRVSQVCVRLLFAHVNDRLEMCASKIGATCSVASRSLVCKDHNRHKSPAPGRHALVTQLQGIGKAHKGLLIFSAAAPVAAIAVHYLFSSITWLTHPQVGAEHGCTGSRH